MVYFRLGDYLFNCMSRKANEMILFHQKKKLSFNQLGITLQDISDIHHHKDKIVHTITRNQKNEFNKALTYLEKNKYLLGDVLHTGSGTSSPNSLRTVINISKECPKLGWVPIYCKI